MTQMSSRASHCYAAIFAYLDGWPNQSDFLACRINISKSSSYRSGCGMNATAKHVYNLTVLMTSYVILRLMVVLNVLH